MYLETTARMPLASATLVMWAMRHLAAVPYTVIRRTPPTQDEQMLQDQRPSHRDFLCQTLLRLASQARGPIMS
jgi:hypothetical protein